MNALKTMIDLKTQMEASGFEWDPAHGYARWTHTRSGITALRQPYMNDKQWTERCVEAIAQAATRSQ